MKKTILVMFGATGDLMRKKVIPALYALEKDGRLSTVQKIIGFSRRGIDSAEFHNHMKTQVEHKMDIEPDILKSLFAKTSFVSGYFNDPEAYKKLAEEIREFKDDDTQVLHYLAVAPKYYADIIEAIPHCTSELGSCEVSVVIEKPVGTSLEESREVQSILEKEFDDEHIYRADHYLHKRVVDSIMDFRFRNPLFESGWSNQNITKVTIKTNEAFGLEERGSFYDPLGALRDVGQNHLMSLLAVTLMDTPKTLDAAGIREARSNLLMQLEPVKPENMTSQTYRAQYEGYRDIENVHPESITETYFKIKTSINSKRWRNVPIILEAGKKIATVEKEVLIELKNGGSIQFSFEGEDLGVFMNINTKDGIQKERILHIEEKERFVSEYMEMIMSLVKADKTWFVTKEEIEASWKFTDPVSSAWFSGKVPLHFYNQDSLESVKESTYIVEREVHRSQIGIIGLGKMGGGIAKQLHEHGWKVIAQNRSRDKVDEFIKFGGKGVDTYKELVDSLSSPRIIWTMVPSGDAIEQTLLGEDGLINLLEPGDTVIDGGNSNYKETLRRAELFKKIGINFVDAGVSGGPSGARNGACVMIGGTAESFKKTEHIFTDISLPGGYKFFEGHAAGHFVKMVHNGIEYGMMQAIGEGFEVLKESKFNLDLQSVSEVYGVGSVIESSLIDWLYSAYQKYTTELNPISGEVHHSGEGAWTVQAAQELGIPVKVIEDALQFRIDSKGNPSYTGQVVSALRGEFGGHPVKK